MSDMRTLLESMYKFAGEPEQKPGDQVRGTEKAKKSSKGHPFKGRLVGANESAEYCDACDRPAKDCVCDEELKESLMQEYKYFIEQNPAMANTAPASNTTSPTPAQTPAGGAPGPGGQTTTQPAATGTVPAGQQPATGGTATATTQAKPGQPAPAGQQPVGGVKPTGASGSMTPPNPQQIKKDTEALTKVMNNPMSPLNKELQALIKKAALLPK